MRLRPPGLQHDLRAAGGVREAHRDQPDRGDVQAVREERLADQDQQQGYELAEYGTLQHAGGQLHNPERRADGERRGPVLGGQRRRDQPPRGGDHPARRLHPQLLRGHLRPADDPGVPPHLLQDDAGGRTGRLRHHRRAGRLQLRPDLLPPGPRRPVLRVRGRDRAPAAAAEQHGHLRRLAVSADGLDLQPREDPGHGHDHERHVLRRRAPRHAPVGLLYRAPLRVVHLDAGLYGLRPGGLETHREVQPAAGLLAERVLPQVLGHVPRPACLHADQHREHAAEEHQHGERARHCLPHRVPHCDGHLDSDHRAGRLRLGHGLREQCGIQPEVEPLGERLPHPHGRQRRAQPAHLECLHLQGRDEVRLRRDGVHPEPKPADLLKLLLHRVRLQGGGNPAASLRLGARRAPCRGPDQHAGRLREQPRGLLGQPHGVPLPVGLHAHRERRRGHQGRPEHARLHLRGRLRAQDAGRLPAAAARHPLRVRARDGLDSPDHAEGAAGGLPAARLLQVRAEGLQPQHAHHHGGQVDVRLLRAGGHLPVGREEGRRARRPGLRGQQRHAGRPAPRPDPRAGRRDEPQRQARAAEPADLPLQAERLARGRAGPGPPGAARRAVRPGLPAGTEDRREPGLRRQHGRLVAARLREVAARLRAEPVRGHRAQGLHPDPQRPAAPQLLRLPPRRRPEPDGDAGVEPLEHDVQRRDLRPVPGLHGLDLHGHDAAPAGELREVADRSERRADGEPGDAGVHAVQVDPGEAAELESGRPHARHGARRLLLCEAEPGVHRGPFRDGADGRHHVHAQRGLCLRGRPDGREDEHLHDGREENPGPGVRQRQGLHDDRAGLQPSRHRVRGDLEDGLLLGGRRGDAHGAGRLAGDGLPDQRRAHHLHGHQHEQRPEGRRGGERRGHHPPLPGSDQGRRRHRGEGAPGLQPRRRRGHERLQRLPLPGQQQPLPDDGLPVLRLQDAAAGLRHLMARAREPGPGVPAERGHPLQDRDDQPHPDAASDGQLLEDRALSRERRQVLARGEVVEHQPAAGPRRDRDHRPQSGRGDAVRPHLHHHPGPERRHHQARGALPDRVRLQHRHRRRAVRHRPGHAGPDHHRQPPDEPADRRPALRAQDQLRAAGPRRRPDALEPHDVPGRDPRGEARRAPPVRGRLPPARQDLRAGRAGAAESVQGVPRHVPGEVPLPAARQRGRHGALPPLVLAERERAADAEDHVPGGRRVHPAHLALRDHRHRPDPGLHRAGPVRRPSRDGAARPPGVRGRAAEGHAVLHHDAGVPQAGHQHVALRHHRHHRLHEHERRRDPGLHARGAHGAHRADAAEPADGDHRGHAQHRPGQRRHPRAADHRAAGLHVRRARRWLRRHVHARKVPGGPPHGNHRLADRRAPHEALRPSHPGADPGDDAARNGLGRPHVVRGGPRPGRRDDDGVGRGHRLHRDADDGHARVLRWHRQPPGHADLLHLPGRCRRGQLHLGDPAAGLPPHLLHGGLPEADQPPRWPPELHRRPAAAAAAAAADRRSLRLRHHGGPPGPDARRQHVQHHHPRPGQQRRGRCLPHPGTGAAPHRRGAPDAGLVPGRPRPAEHRHGRDDLQPRHHHRQGAPDHPARPLPA
mmetsp:Transcript_52061/g.153568  ORF Transcript_52061/g.153568 Transcript_52061/m.153568 type:complete len:1607 (-) Transcript_52061:467-5287(-)